LPGVLGVPPNSSEEGGGFRGLMEKCRGEVAPPVRPELVEGPFMVRQAHYERFNVRRSWDEIATK
jgi:hypothetical protein